MKDNRVRQRVKNGQPTIGCFLGLGSPTVAEMMGLAGMDWLVVETEHNALDSAEVQQMLMADRQHGRCAYRPRAKPRPGVHPARARHGRNGHPGARRENC